MEASKELSPPEITHASSVALSGNEWEVAVSDIMTSLLGVVTLRLSRNCQKLSGKTIGSVAIPRVA